MAYFLNIFGFEGLKYFKWKITYKQYSYKSLKILKINENICFLALLLIFQYVKLFFFLVNSKFPSCLFCALRASDDGCTAYPYLLSCRSNFQNNGLDLVISYVCLSITSYQSSFIMEEGKIKGKINAMNVPRKEFINVW